MASEITYNMQTSPQVTVGTYFPLKYDPAPPISARTNAIVQALLNHWSPRSMSVSQWKKQPPFSVTSTDDKGAPLKSTPLSFDQLSKHLKENRKLLHAELKLPRVQCAWLDPSVVVRQLFYAPVNPPNTGSFALALTSKLGAAFPILPMVDREGLALSSLQHHLTQTVIRTRHQLVSRSDRMLGADDTWLDDLMVYMNSSVALVENLLHQLYYKAKFDAPAMGWKFDEERLGQTHRRPLKEKIRWVYDITGQLVNSMDDQLRNVMKLKEIRNHLNHFDPPAFAMTIEDAALWLNFCDDLAVLLSKLRQKIGSPLSVPLIELLLLPRVEWSPFDPGIPRLPQPPTSGYASCQWPATPPTVASETVDNSS